MVSDVPETADLLDSSEKMNDGDLCLNTVTDLNQNCTSVAIVREMQDAITARNSSESPLLKLPAELRVMIWEFAIGGYALEANLRNKLIKARIPHYTGHDIKLKYLEDFDNIPFELTEFSQAFRKGLTQPICRQIRRESYNFQFPRNIFMFNEKWDMYHFLRDFTDEQLHAVREIYVSCYFCTGKGAYLRLPNVFKRLSNLKRIFVEPDIHSPSGELLRPPRQSVETAAFVLAAGEDLPTDGSMGIDMIAIEIWNYSKKIKDSYLAVRL